MKSFIILSVALIFLSKAIVSDAQQCSQCFYHSNQDAWFAKPGIPLRYGYASSVRNCCDQCRSVAGCLTYFYTNSGVCNLYKNSHSDFSYFYSPGVYGGIMLCPA